MTRHLAAALLLVVAACSDPSGAVTPGPTPLDDPATIARTGRPNDYLVCPQGTCATAPDRVSPVYLVPVDRLAEAWRAVVAAAPRTREVDADPARRIERFEQRSTLFGFRDTILVRYLPLDDERSTLIVYSRSELGYWDLGVNRRRVEAWLAALDASLPHDPSR